METRKEQLHAALVDAFTLAEMERLLSFGLGKTLPTGRSKEDIFFEVVEAAWRGGWLLDLARAAYSERAENEKIRAFHDTHLRMVFADERPPQPRPQRMMSSNEIDMSAVERIQRLELWLNGVDGDNGVRGRQRSMEAELRAATSELAAVKATLTQLLSMVGQLRDERAADGEPWTQWLFWLVAALVLVPLAINFVRAVTGG